MRMEKYRKLLAVLLMLAFTGQVVASATVSCQNQPASSHEQMMMDPDVMDHSQHMSMGESSADVTGDSECCPDCECSLGGCAATALPTSQPTLISNLASSMSHYKALTVSQLSASLFRPPISR
jgi:uncharacterized protein involved in copper resistance